VSEDPAATAEAEPAPRASRWTRGSAGISRHPLRALVLVLLVAWALYVVAVVGLAVRDLQEGRRIATGVAHRGAPALADGRSSADLRTARARFQRARDLLHSPVLTPARGFPVLGRQLRTGTALASAAARASAVGIDAVDQGRRILALPHQDGPQRVAQLRALSSLAERTQARLTPFGFGPGGNLLPPVAHARTKLVNEVTGLRNGLRKAAAGGQAVADLLAGPKRYLVFAANNAEMRAGSGMFLSVGELVTQDGTLHLDGMSTVTEVPQPQNVPLEGDMAARWGWLHPEVEWRNLMLSPRFDASAELATRMWSAIGRGPVDGVLALDPVTLRAILDATGPVPVAGLTVSADNVVDELLHAQYLRFPSDAQLSERRSDLSAIATAAVEALQTRTWSAAHLAEGIGGAVRGRHVLLWSASPQEERAWETAGVAGTLKPNSLLLSVVSRGGNKLDQYLGITSGLSLRRVGNRTEGAVRVTLRNSAPPGEPSIIDGPYVGIGINEGEYLGILTVNLPADAMQARIDGVPQLAVAGPDGATIVVGTQFRLPQAQSQTFVVRFDVPASSGAMQLEPSARVPTVQWRAPGHHWSDGIAHEVSW
jgi:hypothetical protein